MTDQGCDTHPITDWHHEAPKPLTPEALTAPDPGLALVQADMDAWLEAHPCTCEAECECEEEE